MSKFEQLYDDISLRKSAAKDFEPYQRGHNGRIDRCVGFFEEGVLKNGRSMLDIGGSIGDLGDVLKDRFIETTILDISNVPLKAAKSKGHRTVCANTDVDGIPELSESYCFVAALDVIEHVLDPEKMVREAFRVLKHGGQFYINTPNIMFWRHLDFLLKSRRFPHTSGDREVFHGGHTAFFTRSDIRQLCSDAGFFVKILKDPLTRTEAPKTFVESVLNISQSAYELYEDIEYPDVLVLAEKP